MGWLLFCHGVVVVCCVVATLHRSYGCHITNSPGVRRGWRTEAGTYLNENDSDDMSSPSGRCGTSATSSPLSTWLQSFVTLVLSSVCVVRAVVSRSWLVVVVAVGESGEGVGSVGGNGGGWKGTIVGCLLIVDNNKSTKRVSVFADARFGCN